MRTLLSVIFTLTSLFCLGVTAMAGDGDGTKIEKSIKSVPQEVSNLKDTVTNLDKDVKKSIQNSVEYFAEEPTKVEIKKSPFHSMNGRFLKSINAVKEKAGINLNTDNLLGSIGLNQSLKCIGHKILNC